jgi:5'-deoxynucleotidase YfbR-like HD superfamily hydrolase
MPVDLLAPKPEMTLLHDIAWSLARTARFGGHTTGEVPWSNAQHSCLVENLMPEDASPHDRLVALLHDAHEFAIGDIFSPVVKALDALWEEKTAAFKAGYRGLAPSECLNVLKARMDAVIWTTFGLSPSEACLAAVKTADAQALRVEADALMADRRQEWTWLVDAPDPAPHLRPCHPPARAYEVFLDRFRVLQDARHGLTRLAD